MTQPLHTIVTHAGSFHADEIMAIVLLERFYLVRPVWVNIEADADTQLAWISGEKVPAHNTWNEDGVQDVRTPVAVIRSRDARVLEAARNSPTTFVVDVGGVLDRAQLNFDHHQKSMRETWPDGTPLSSTGLIWLWLQQHGHLAELPTEVCRDIERHIIKPLDAHDNGVASSSLASTLATYNRSSDDPAEQNRQFAKAKALMNDALDNELFSARMRLHASTVIAQQWRKAQAAGETHVLLPRGVDYKDCAGLLKEISKDQAHMIIIPGQGKRFSIISVNKDVAFSIKSPCPEAWRGKMDLSVDIDGRPILVRFAHKTGFMCVVEGTTKDAHTAARHIIAHNNLNVRLVPAHTNRHPQNTSRTLSLRPKP